MRTLLLLFLSCLTALGAGGSASSSTRYTPNCSGSPSQWCEAQWSTNDGSGRIAGMVDLSGAGRPMIGGGTTANPTWTNNAQAGRPAAMFTSTSLQVFTNTVISYAPSSVQSIYAVYVGKASDSTANFEAWTAQGLAVNAQFGCNAGSAGIKSFTGTTTTSTVANNMSTAFMQVAIALEHNGTNGGVQSVITNGVAATQSDGNVITTAATFGSFGKILTIYGDMYYCGGAIWRYIPPISHRVLINEYFHQYQCYR